MNKIIFAIISTCGLGLYGSTVTLPLTTSNPTVFTVTESNFAIFGNNMAGMLITGNFGGTSETCTFTAAGNCSDAGGNFTISFPVGQDTDPDVSGANGVWTITDTTKTLSALTSVTINALAGNIGFDRCLTNTGFDDTNFGYTVCNTGGAIEGTPGSADGWSVGNAAGGTAGITASALYFDALHTSGGPIVGDAWGGLTLTFAGASFVSGDTFTFRADTDAVVTQVSDTPEIGTLGLVGAMLLGIGALRLRFGARVS